MTSPDSSQPIADAYLDFIRAHYGVDMSPAEIGLYLELSEAQVLSVAKHHGFKRKGGLTAVHAPVIEFAIARGIQRARIEE